MKPISEIEKKKKLVIFGLGDFADIAFEYFNADSEYQVVAFTVHENFIIESTKFGIPVIPFEKLNSFVDPGSHSFFAAVLYMKMNDFRMELALAAKKMGFSLATYISSRSFVWENTTIGEHCFIFEENTIQPFVSIGFNNILWSGNHIGHHSHIGHSCFISSHVVLSGSCTLEGSSFIGVNSTLSNNITIGSRTWIGPGALITKNVPAGSLVSSMPSKVRELDELVLENRLQAISSQSVTSRSEI